MTALAAIAAIVAALYSLRAVERRHAGREAERLTAMRRLREWHPPQPNARAPRHLTSITDPVLRHAIRRSGIAAVDSDRITALLAELRQPQDGAA